MVDGDAAKAYIAYFFEHYAEDEILSTIRDANVPSWKTAEKAGFVIRFVKISESLEGYYYEFFN